MTSVDGWETKIDQTRLLQRAIDVQKRAGSGIMATLVDAARWKEGETPKLFYKPGDERLGALSNCDEIEDKLLKEAPGLLKARKAELLVYQDSEGNVVEVFAEPLVSETTLYVFGAGMSLCRSCLLQPGSDLGP